MLEPILCGPLLHGHPFSRSYGVILPSSLTMLLPPALGFSPHPPVSVCGTGSYETIAAFLDSQLTSFATLSFATRHVFALQHGFSGAAATPLVPGFPFPALALCLCPHSSVHMKYRNLHLLSIGYAFRPHLRTRLTQGGRALPLETLGFRRMGFSPILSLLTPAYSLLSAPAALPVNLLCT